MNQGMIVLLCCLRDCSFDSLQPLRCVWCAVTPKDATIGPAGSKPSTQLSPCMPNRTHRGVVWQQAGGTPPRDEKRGCLRVMLNKDLSKSAAFQMSINKIISQRAAQSKSMLSVEFGRHPPLRIMLVVHFPRPANYTLYCDNVTNGAEGEGKQLSILAFQTKSISGKRARTAPTTVTASHRVKEEEPTSWNETSHKGSKYFSYSDEIRNRMIWPSALNLLSARVKMGWRAFVLLSRYEMIFILHVAEPIVRPQPCTLTGQEAINNILTAVFLIILDGVYWWNMSLFSC